MKSVKEVPQPGAFQMRLARRAQLNRATNLKEADAAVSPRDSEGSAVIILELTALSQLPTSQAGNAGESCSSRLHHRCSLQPKQGSPFQARLLSPPHHPHPLALQQQRAPRGDIPPPGSPPRGAGPESTAEPPLQRPRAVSSGRSDSAKEP